ncbi:MAG TPA: tetratricopeptide repeat protein [Gemmatimonadales bacterium]|nr:tetratricopeptide repeat protein [Gemmatimonadales bacterium]
MKSVRKSVRLIAALGLTAAAGTAPAQIAYTPPAEKLLVLPLMVKTPADSAMSIAVMDVTREKLGSMARSRVQVIPKTKLCEALKASDYPCDVLLDETQANQLARFLSVNAYTIGTLDRSGGALVARVRVRDIGSSGMASLFTVTSANPATAASLGEAIAQRANTVVRAAEHARECNDQRQKSQFGKALDAARKALVTEPNLTAAHLCVETVYEAQHLPLDSLIAAALRAAKGDSLNATAWETVGHAYQQKGDTLKAIDAFTHELAGESQNTQLRLGIAELLRQQRQFERAKSVLDDGLAHNPGDDRLLAFRQRICIEGELNRCTLDGFVEQVKLDTSKLADTTLLKGAMGAAQALSDTTQLLFFTRAAVRHVPKSPTFWKALGTAYDLKGQKDSSQWAYKQSLKLDPSDIKGSLLVARAIVEGTIYDTAQANKLKPDTAALRAFRNAFADRVDSAKAYLAPALSSSDSTDRVSAAVFMLTGGSKIAQAGAYDRAYPWLEQLLQVVAPRSPADTVGPRQQIRVQASFWYGVSSVGPLFAQYSVMVKSKSCGEAKAVNDWIARAKEALVLGARVHPPTANAMLQNISKLEGIMPQVKKQFKCKNF